MKLLIALMIDINFLFQGQENLLPNSESRQFCASQLALLFTELSHDRLFRYQRQVHFLRTHKKGFINTKTVYVLRQRFSNIVISTRIPLWVPARVQT